MVELMSGPSATAVTPFTYRLATDADGNHGYEIGRWLEGADLNDPNQFVVVEKCYDQQEAAARTLARNRSEASTEPSAEDAEEDEPHPSRHAAPRHRK